MTQRIPLHINAGASYVNQGTWSLLEQVLFRILLHEYGIKAFSVILIGGRRHRGGLVLRSNIELIADGMWRGR